MMPTAQPITTICPPTLKPKIGFSIDSIVGKSLKNAGNKDSNASLENRPKLAKSPSDLRREYSHLMKRTRLNLTLSPRDSENEIKCSSRLSESESSGQDVQNNNNDTDIYNERTLKIPSRNNHSKPIVVPGIPAGLGMMNRSPMIAPPHQLPLYPESPSSHPHFLQFQAAAALVHAQAAQTGFGGALPQHLPHLHNHNMPRDSYPLYPWLLSRHGRIFPHRFPGSK